MDTLLQYFTNSNLSLTSDPSLPWNSAAVAARRALLPGRALFYDRLLQLAQIDPLFYPPSDFPSLRRLLAAILDSPTFDLLKKNCLIYYLLTDYADHRETSFGKFKRIPKKFVTTTEGYWHLDNGEYELGVAKLCSPGVTPDFVNAILPALAANVSSQQLSSKLICSLIIFTEPAVTEQADIQLIVNAFLVKGNLAEAFRRMRDFLVVLETEGGQEQAQLARREMIEASLNICFTSNPPLSTSLKRLLHLPLTSVEDACLMTWITVATKSTSSASKIPNHVLPVVSEWATNQLVAQGRYVEAITLLSDSMSSFRTSSEAVKKTQNTLKEIYTILPPVQQSIVDLSLSSMLGTGAKDGDKSRGKDVTESTSASAAITQIPWLPTPALPTLPAPRSLVEAQGNASTLRELSLGGPRLNKGSDLPMSASGLLKDTGRPIGIGREGRRDERMDLLGAVKRAESPMKFASERSRPGSPFQTGTSVASHLGSFSRLQPEIQRREDSPFSAASLVSYAASAGSMSSHKPTVQGFGLERPLNAQNYSAGPRLDFSEQLRKYQTQAQSQTLDSKMGMDKPKREQRNKEDRELQISTTTTTSTPGPRKGLPPGAFPSVTENDDGFDDSDLDEDQQSQISDVTALSTRSVRATADRTSHVPAQEPTIKKKARPRTTSQRDTAARTPNKKGRKSTMPDEQVEPTPRRSRRLGSVAPSDAGDDEVEDSMIGRGSKAKTPRRRRL